MYIYIYTHMAACCMCVACVLQCVAVSTALFADILEESQDPATGWRRLIGCLIVKVIFRKRAL